MKRLIYHSTAKLLGGLTLNGIILGTGVRAGKKQTEIFRSLPEAEQKKSRVMEIGLRDDGWYHSDSAYLSSIAILNYRVDSHLQQRSKNQYLNRPEQVPIGAPCLKK